MVEALKALSSFFDDNSLRSRRNLRGDIEKRSLTINESFERTFREVKEVKINIKCICLSMFTNTQTQTWLQLAHPWCKNLLCSRVT